MLRTTLVCATLALIAATETGCTDGPPPSSMVQSGMAMSNTDYVNAAAESDQFEIQAAQFALAQSHSPPIRDFANTMVRDHTRLSQALMAAAAQSGIRLPPPALRSDHQQMLSELQGLSGPAFDRAYVGEQVSAHEEALSLQTAYAEGGADSTLRASASNAVPIIRQHLDMARQLRLSTGG